MKDELEILITGWHPFESADAVYANTLADIEVHAGDVCLTELVDKRSRTTRSHIRASAYDLALWLSGNFWRLRWESVPLFSADSDTDWQMAHCLPSIGGGFVWPDITVTGNDGELVVLQCKVSDSPNTSIRFLRQFEGNVTAQSVERSIAAFADTVISRLYEFGVHKSPLELLWEDVQKERATTKVTVPRRLEALLGLDPDQNSSVVEELLRTWVPKMGLLAVEEVSASSGWLAVRDVLARTEIKAKTTRLHGRISEFSNLRSTAPLLGGTNGRPWQHARDLAYLLRENWQFGSSPISETQLSDATGLTQKDLAKVDTALPFSFSVNDSQNDRFGLALARPRDESRRFDIARLIGDQIAFDENERIKPATAATTLRQKFQRAFAAEFLCPSQVVRGRATAARTTDELENTLEQIASDFGVSGAVVMHHFQNHGLPFGDRYVSL